MNALVAIADEVKERLLKVVSEHRRCTLDEHRRIFGKEIDKAGVVMSQLDRRTRGDHIVAQAIVRAFRSECGRTPHLTLKSTVLIALSAIHGPVTGSDIAKSTSFRDILAIYH